MLQIIGWMGCFYLFVKALEITSSNEHRNSEGGVHAAGIAAVIAALLGALVFSLMLYAQGSAMP